MSCKTTKNCNCNFNLRNFGTYDLSRVKINGSDRTQLNWSELSTPEILSIPEEKPEIEQLDQVYVDAKINCAKLIETPFAFKSYDRLATELEIATATSAINSANVDITPVTTAVGTILAVPGLPAIPEVTALQNSLNAVTAANTNLTTTISTATTVLSGPCVSAAAVAEQLQNVSAATAAEQAALNGLVTSANALAAATAGDPIVGPLVAAAVATLVTAVNTANASLDTALAALASAIASIGNTSIFVILPNEEGTCLSGRKLVVEGVLNQKIVYTGLVTTQSVHSICREILFTAYVIPYANFQGLVYEENVEVIIDSTVVPCVTGFVNGFSYDPDVPIVVELCEEFCLNAYIEDVFAYVIDKRTVFKNATLFLLAKPVTLCS